MENFTNNEIDKLIDLAMKYHEDMVDLDNIKKYDNLDCDIDNILDMSYVGLDKRFLDGVWEIVKERSNNN